jgi:hypothetical protein
VAELAGEMSMPTVVIRLGHLHQGRLYHEKGLVYQHVAQGMDILTKTSWKDHRPETQSYNKHNYIYGLIYLCQ